MRISLPVLLLTFLCIGFQNCAGPKAAEAEGSSTQSTPTEIKVLGIYDTHDIKFLKVARQTVSGIHPELTVRFLASGVPSSFTLDLLDQTGNYQCGFSTSVDAELAARFATAANGMKLGVVAPKASVGTGCSETSVVISLKNSTSHTFKIQSDCSAGGELNIQDPMNLMDMWAAGLFAGHDTCTE